MEWSEMVPISVIIPVYNVYQWLDECMKSVVNQTFKDFEIILINDGSTDGSEIKCQEWVEKDSRVKLISKKNEGPSVARNYGIWNAQGKYLVFIDADDWIEDTYLEKLYDAVIEKKVPFAECDVYRFNNDTGEKTYHVCSGNMGCEYTLEEHMIYGYPAIWKCIVKKSLFIDNKIEFPNCHGESKPVYILLLAVSGSVANVHEGLYYYRRFRPGSLTAIPRINNGDENAIGIKAADYLIDGFRTLGLYDRYKGLLEKTIKLGFSDRLAGLFYRKNKTDFFQLEEKYRFYINQKFPETINYKYIVWGGYNLNRIIRHLNLLHNPYCRFNFSSIISLMNPIGSALVCSHKNKYREIMINRELNVDFWNIIKEIEVQYIFMDFIEERFDLLKYMGGYITKSNAFDEASIELSDYQIVKRNSEKCIDLWKVSFNKFIEKLRVELPECSIVIIENYLSEKSGDFKEISYFKNIDEIKEANQQLKGYYDYIAANYTQLPFIKATECEYYYTDKAYEYGAIPSHLNEIVNQKIAQKVQGKIGI